MTLSIIHTESSLGWGGQELRVLTEAAGCVRRGHRVMLLAPPQATLLQRAAEFGVPAHPLPLAGKNPRALWALQRWLRNATADLLVSHSSTDSWLAALAVRLSRPLPIVRLRHISAPVPRNRATRWLYRHGCRHVVTTGASIRSDLMARLGLPPERVTSIPTGIDLERYAPGSREAARQRLGLPQGETLMGIVATLRSWKGHADLLHAVARMNRPATRLVVVGNGPQWENLHQLAGDLGLGPRVLFVGEQRDVVPWLQSLDLFVLPSYANEGVPQSLMQAMAVALPVVSTPVGAIGELVLPGQTGFMTPPRDVAALADTLHRVLEDPDGAAAMARRGRQRVVDQFGMETMLDRMEAVFRQVTASPPGG
ncbi:MAG: glycosyltransferase [Magnetococcus sp. WYHC-3]